MDFYNLFGWVNTFFILVSLFGIYSQLTTILFRKKSQPNKGQATALLSLNQFSVSYLAYLAFFVYGYSIEPFNHYIVWPRLLACILVAFILLEIWRERKSTLSQLVVCFVACSLILAIIGLFSVESFADEGKYLSTTIILLVSIFIAQGYYHQIKLIIDSGETGAVDIKMSQFILMMDISTIAFALSMGWQEAWPLLVLATTSGITKIIIMYLFKWVKTSQLAKARRDLVSF